MSKILIAVPTFESITPDTYKSIWDMDKGGNECLFEFVRGYDCAHARMHIVYRTKNLGCDYVLMVDSDVVLPKDALVNLLSHDVDVCLGYYAHKGCYDGKTCLCEMGRVNYDSQLYYDELKELEEDGQYLLQIKGGGMGCALIKASVFDRTQYPWFDWVTYKDGHGILSEDLYFCQQCALSGIKVYADTRVHCGHRFAKVVNLDG